MSYKKILILYTSTGLGHKSIAENMGYYWSRLDMGLRLGMLTRSSQQAWITTTESIWVYSKGRLFGGGLRLGLFTLCLKVFLARFTIKRKSLLNN